MSSPDPRRVRIGNDEREAAVRELGEHFAHGRLEPDEYEERVSAAYTARTTADLDILFEDLPGRPGTVTDSATVALHAGMRMPATPDAPYGRDPVTGAAYSDRYKIAAGLLQLFLAFGIGRFYSGHTGIAVAQLLLSFTGIGIIWSWIDGIVMLAGHPTDPHGRPLRP